MKRLLIPLVPLVVVALSAAKCVFPLLPPSGYTAGQEIFDDSFTGTSLNSSHWVTYLGCCGTRWDNAGSLPAPYSGPTSTANGGTGYNEAMYAPSQVSVNDGLTLTASPNTNKWSKTYPWLSGVASTEGKVTLPSSGWYVQVRARMANVSAGMWPAIWFLPAHSGNPFNELDGFEGGMVDGSNPPNDVYSSNYFANQGQQGKVQNVGVNLSSGAHVYGIEYLPGKSITWYLDGKEVAQVLASSRVTITAESYEIILELEVAAPKTWGWHTPAGPGTKATTMTVNEVQAYAK